MPFFLVSRACFRVNPRSRTLLDHVLFFAWLFIWRKGGGWGLAGIGQILECSFSFPSSFPRCLHTSGLKERRAWLYRFWQFNHHSKALAEIIKNIPKAAFCHFSKRFHHCCRSKSDFVDFCGTKQILQNVVKFDECFQGTRRISWILMRVNLWLQYSTISKGNNERFPQDFFGGNTN
jgi:hypothetical protein